MMKFNLSRCIFSLLCVCALSLSLSGCLVDASDPKKKFTITLPSHLRLYQGGEFVKYSVRAFKSNVDANQFEDLTGEMVTKWSTASLNQPFVGDQLNVMKKVTTLTTGDGEIGSIRFLTQSPPETEDQGSTFAVAFTDVSETDLLWVDTDADVTDNESVKTLWSPFELLTETNTGLDTDPHPYSFRVMGRCDQAACQHEGTMTVTEFVNVGPTEVTTAYGKFEVYQLSYAGTYVPQVNLLSVVDIRLACGIGSSEVISFDGDLYVHPELGVVQMDNRCQVGSTYINYFIQVTDTDIALTSN